MSSIDLSNSQVLRNFLLCQAREGKGKLFEKEKVLCFKNEAGLEYIIPDEYAEEIRGKLPIEKPAKVAEVKKEEDTELISLREEYIQKIGNIPTPFKNNKEWIQKKLTEFGAFEAK